MPLIKFKRVWDYCTYNKPFFVFILILFAIITFIEGTYGYSSDLYMAWLILMACAVLLNGYGMTITRDRANHGYRLPKVLPKDVLLLGIKSTLVYTVYVLIQEQILDLVSYPFGFEPFDLEDMLFHFSDTIYMLYAHNPVDTIEFLVFGAIFFYILVFFIEIALARLADTGKLLSAFNVVAIHKNISSVGWFHYARDCTAIILVMVILALIRAQVFPIPIIEYVGDVFLSLLIFATQFLGIGAIYAEIKDKSN